MVTAAGGEHEVAHASDVLCQSDPGASRIASRSPVDHVGHARASVAISERPWHDGQVREQLATVRHDERARFGPVGPLLPILPVQMPGIAVRLEARRSHQFHDGGRVLRGRGPHPIACRDTLGELGLARLTLCAPRLRWTTLQIPAGWSSNNSMVQNGPIEYWFITALAPIPPHHSRDLRFRRSGPGADSAAVGSRALLLGSRGPSVLAERPRAPQALDGLARRDLHPRLSDSPALALAHRSRP